MVGSMIQKKLLRVLILTIMLICLGGCTKKDNTAEMTEKKPYKKLFYDCGMSMEHNVDTDFLFDD